ncbi:MAG: aspartyl/glutamyl-tRNA amidotransferase subunit C [Ruminococcus sp.]|nr:aspartyl/glutamyl-tRNA amidotransferase subunit C [Ruminococcus sp.]
MRMDIQHIAKLARLHIEAEALSVFEKEMETIVKMAEHLPEAEDALLPDRETPMQLRRDEAEDGKFTREEMLMNAPEVQLGCLAVPKTVG